VVGRDENKDRDSLGTVPQASNEAGPSSSTMGDRGNLEPGQTKHVEIRLDERSFHIGWSLASVG